MDVEFTTNVAIINLISCTSLATIVINNKHVNKNYTKITISSFLLLYIFYIEYYDVFTSMIFWEYSTYF